MYYAVVACLMFLFPVASIAADATMSGATIGFPLIGRWFVLWSVGVRLVLAGVNHLMRPRRIEVLTGPASLLGPNGLGGAINLITKRGGGPPGAPLEVGGGSFGRAEASLSSSGQLGGTWNYYGDFGGERADGWRAASSERASHAFANLSRVAGERGVSVQGYVSQSRAGTAGSLPESIFDSSPRVNFTAGDVDDIDLEQLAASAFTSFASGRASLTTYLRRSHAYRFNANQPPDPDVRGLTDNLSQGARRPRARPLGILHRRPQFAR